MCICYQGDGDEGSDPGERAAPGPQDLPEDVLLHHAGRHAAAPPLHPRSHDGELLQTLFIVYVLYKTE